MFRLLRLSFLVLGLCLLVVSGLLARGRGDGDVHLIGFLSNRDGNSEFFIMNPDGTSQRQVTFTNSRQHRHCAFEWAVKGAAVYLSIGTPIPQSSLFCEGDKQTYSRTSIMRYAPQPSSFSDGFLLTQLTGQSSDGETLLLTQGQSFLDAELYLYNLTTESRQSLASVDLSHWVRLSQNDQWIVYTDYGETERSIHVYRTRLDGSDKQAITPAMLGRDLICGVISVSPDSQWVVFAGKDNRTSCGSLYRAPLDEPIFGEHVELVLDLQQQNTCCSFTYSGYQWSPDSQSLVYWTDSSELVVLSWKNDTLQNTSILQLPRVSTSDVWGTSWSPDGDWIVFSVNNFRDLHHKIYRLHPDGTNLEQLTTGDYNDIMPKYSPPMNIPYRTGLPFGAGIACLLIYILLLLRHETNL